MWWPRLVAKASHRWNRKRCVQTHRSGGRKSCIFHHYTLHRKYIPSTPSRWRLARTSINSRAPPDVVYLLKCILPPTAACTCLGHQRTWTSALARASQPWALRRCCLPACSETGSGGWTEGPPFSTNRMVGEAAGEETQHRVRDELRFCLKNNGSRRGGGKEVYPPCLCCRKAEIFACGVLPSVRHLANSIWSVVLQ